MHKKVQQQLQQPQPRKYMFSCENLGKFIKLHMQFGVCLPLGMVELNRLQANIWNTVSKIQLIFFDLSFFVTAKTEGGNRRNN